MIEFSTYSLILSKIYDISLRIDYESSKFLAEIENNTYESGVTKGYARMYSGGRRHKGLARM